MNAVVGQCRNPDQIADVLRTAGWVTTTDTEVSYVFTPAGEHAQGYGAVGWHQDENCGEWIAVWANTNPTEFPDREPVAPFDVVLFDQWQRHRTAQHPVAKDRLFVRVTHLVHVGGDQ